MILNGYVWSEEAFDLKEKLFKGPWQSRFMLVRYVIEDLFCQVTAVGLKSACEKAHDNMKKKTSLTKDSSNQDS